MGLSPVFVIVSFNTNGKSASKGPSTLASSLAETPVCSIGRLSDSSNPIETEGKRHNTAIRIRLIADSPIHSGTRLYRDWLTDLPLRPLTNHSSIQRVAFDGFYAGFADEVVKLDDSQAFGSFGSGVVVDQFVD